MTVEFENKEVAKAVETLASALKEDEAFYYAYQANIAVAFQDAWHLAAVKDIHSISNDAAKSFLNLFIQQSTK